MFPTELQQWLFGWALVFGMAALSLFLTLGAIGLLFAFLFLIWDAITDRPKGLNGEFTGKYCDCCKQPIFENPTYTLKELERRESRGTADRTGDRT